MTEPPPPSPPDAAAGTAGAATQRRGILGHIFSLPGLAVVFVAGAGTILGFWEDIRPYLFGPELELRLTECTSSRISLSVQNKGGRPAVVSEPIFKRYRNGAWEDLPIEDFVGGGTFTSAHSRIDPGSGYVLNYSSDDIPFFLPEWWRGQQCPVEARMALDTSDEPQQAECPCARSR